MEKKVDRFKNTAVVTLRREENQKSLVEQLIYSSNQQYFSFFPPEYSILYDLYVNNKKIPGKYLYPYEGCILDSKTLEEITEENIINFLLN